MTTRTVPTDFPTIAAAAAASQPGDVINVVQGYSGSETSNIPVSDLTINVSQSFGQIVLTLAGTNTTLSATGAGNITLVGNAGDNVLIGNDGVNVLRGGPGNDLLIGGGWIVHPGGGTSNDSVDYSGASGAIDAALTDAPFDGGEPGGYSTGADGNDTFKGISNIIGGAFADRLTGNSFGNSLRGNGGNDTLDGAGGVDFVFYSAASSGVTVTLTDGVTGGVIINGGNTGGFASGPDGNDTLINIENIGGSQFADTLTGNSGNNGFLGQRGNDTIDGGAGIDTAFHTSATGAVSVTLFDDGTGLSSGADGNDTLIDIEDIGGSEFADTLTGNRFANTFTGRGGNDTINGGAGIDTAFYFSPRSNYTVTQIGPVTYTVVDNVGKDGTDTLIGIERLRFGGEFVQLSAGTTLDGDDDANILYGSDGNDVLNGNGGDDVIRPGRGNDTVYGGNGKDILEYASTREEVEVVRNANGSYTISGPTVGTDHAFDIERIAFDGGGAYVLDAQSIIMPLSVVLKNNTYQPMESATLVYRLYAAAYARTPDEGGLIYWADRIIVGDINAELLAQQFRLAPEFIEKYGSNLDDRAYTDKLYSNVLGRPSDQEGLDFWTSHLTENYYNRDQLMAVFAVSPENIDRTAPDVSNGYWVL